MTETVTAFVEVIQHDSNKLVQQTTSGKLIKHMKILL